MSVPSFCMAGNFTIDLIATIFYTHILKVPYGLKGNPVKVGSGPAAVIGDEHCTMPLMGINPLGRRS
jgi:hypothetical protein